ncbi:hypothetical protein STEG23_034605, partial [Scotinomys teguina]
MASATLLPLFVQRAIARTIVLQESIHKGCRVYFHIKILIASLLVQQGSPSKLGSDLLEASVASSGVFACLGWLDMVMRRGSSPIPLLTGMAYTGGEDLFP